MALATKAWVASKDLEQPAEGRMNRRQALGVLGAGFMTLAMGAQTLAGKTRSRINEVLASVPSDLPGVSSERRAILVDNPVRGLIVIRQWHFDPQLDIRSTIAREIIECQAQIQQSLIGLRKAGITDTVYSEGIVPGKVPKPNNTFRKTVLADDERTANEFDLFALGAERVLHDRGVLRLKPGEEAQAFKRSMPIRLNEDDEAIIRKYVYDDRENGLIGQIAKEPEGLVEAIQYGSSHDFHDNIEVWNAAHPRKRISLLTLTPTIIANRDEALAKHLAAADPTKDTVAGQ